MELQKKEITVLVGSKKEFSKYRRRLIILLKDAGWIVVDVNEIIKKDKREVIKNMHISHYVAGKVACYDENYHFGIIISGTGHGSHYLASQRCRKTVPVRVSHIFDENDVLLARKEKNSHVLVIAAKTLLEEDAFRLAKLFLSQRYLKNKKNEKKNSMIRNQ